MVVRILVLVLGLALASCGRETARFATQDVAVDGAAAAALVSDYRASKGLGAVTVDPRLTRIALAQARANAALGDLSHDVGGSFESRLAAHGFDRSYAAENLAAGASSVPGAIAQWKASPGHDRNLLMPQAQRIGLARADSPDSRYKRYWVLVLADR